MPGRGSTSGGPPSQRRSGTLLEMMQVGNSLKVSAVDEATGTEISFVAPLNASRVDIERLAASKLRYVMAKKNGGQ